MAQHGGYFEINGTHSKLYLYQVGSDLPTSGHSFQSKLEAIYVLHARRRAKSDSPAEEPVEKSYEEDFDALFDAVMLPR
jgi:hypothetical protein